MSNTLTFNIINDIRAITDNVYENILLSKISRWRIGGNADLIVKPKDIHELVDIIAFLKQKTIPYLIIGSTSNLLFSDKGLRPVCIQINHNFSEVIFKRNKVIAGAGIWVPKFARKVALKGFSGIEHIVGIPGTLGGLVCMNGGSQRKGIGDHVVYVKAVSPEGNIKLFTKKECEFYYRRSIFQKNDHIIAEICIESKRKKEYKEIRNEMLQIMRSRRAKFPQKAFNCGSTFISDPKLYEHFGPPGKIIEDLGFKGYKVGDAQVSYEHSNFINNISSASAEDVLKIIKEINKSVKKETGIELQAEVKYVQENGKIIPANKV